MTRAEVFEWVRSQYGISPDYPWEGDDEDAVLRHPHNKKWFALVMEISANRIGLNGDKRIDVMNVKCDPLLIGSLAGHGGFYSAYHMNKMHWLTIKLDEASTEQIKSLIDMSYEMTAR